MTLVPIRQRFAFTLKHHASPAAPQSLMSGSVKWFNETAKRSSVPTHMACCFLKSQLLRRIEQLD